MVLRPRRRPRARLALLLASAVLIGCETASSSATAPSPSSNNVAPTPVAAATHFAGVDVFGTDRLDVASLRTRLGADFDDFESAWLAQEFDRAFPLKQALEQRVKERGGFAFVEFSVVQYFRPGQPSWLTVDVVEPQDAARRIAFASAPSETLPDPDGLLERYRKYEELGFELLRGGERLDDEAAKRETFHSVFGFAHEKLAPFRTPLVEGARRHVDELVAILHRDRDRQHRAFAAFLLAFTTDGARLVRELTPACKDADSLVRNNALRVFAETASHHPEVELPLDVVLDCLEFPTTTDRNKAAAILDSLAKRPELRPQMVQRAGPTLVAMLALSQPNNHDYAFSILKTLSGESFDEHDLVTWRRWIELHRSRSSSSS